MHSLRVIKSGEGNQFLLDRSKGNASLVEVINGTPSPISSVYVRDVARLINLFFNINRCSIGYNNTENEKGLGNLWTYFIHIIIVPFWIGRPYG